PLQFGVPCARRPACIARNGRGPEAIRTADGSEGFVEQIQEIDGICIAPPAGKLSAARMRLWERGRRQKGRRQKAEGRRQKAEGRRQKAEGRRQKISACRSPPCHPERERGTWGMGARGSSCAPRPPRSLAHARGDKGGA